jgi:hypothetical protein
MAVNGGFEVGVWKFRMISSLIRSREAFSEEITLKDEPEFADVIDSKVPYFYKAGYDATKKRSWIA